MFEIEIKAWLDNPSETEQILSSFADYKGESFKSDVYWYNKDRNLKIRVREERLISETNTEKNTLYVTIKTKTVSDGMEINSENEFQISDKSAFELFLNQAGFCLQSTKTKISKNYYTQNCHIELVSVDDIGQFFEAEILSHSNEPSVVERNRATLMSILEKCNVPAENIEPRFYSFLQEHKINSKNRLSFPCNKP
jgi:predicted adenylyl cyclase CyaB